MQKPSPIAWFLLILLSLIWGSSFILIKRGLVGLTAEQAGALRIVAAFLFLTPFAVLRLRQVRKNHLLAILSVGFLGTLIPSFLFAFAQTRIESSVSGVINALTPLFTVIVGWVFYGARQGAGVLAGIAISFVGCFLLSMANADGSLSFNSYSLLVVMATICYGLNINIIKFHLSDVPAATVTSVSLLFAGPIGAVFLLGFTDFTGDVIMKDSVQLAAGYVILLGILGTAIALIIFNRLVQLTNPVFASSVTYLIPLVAVVWGLIDGERLGVIHYTGMTTILAGVILANKSRS